MKFKTVNEFYLLVNGFTIGCSFFSILEMAYEPNRFNELVMIATLSAGFVIEGIAYYFRNKKEIKEIIAKQTEKAGHEVKS